MLYRLDTDGDHATLTVGPAGIYADLADAIAALEARGVKHVAIESAPEHEHRAAAVDETLYRVGFDVLDPCEERRSAR